MTTEVILAVTAAVSAAVAILSAWIAWFVGKKNLVRLTQQIEAQNAQLRLQSYVAITARIFEVNKLFVDNPELRRYFYDGVVLTDKEVMAKASSVAEFLLDFYSTIQEHQAFLDQDVPTWEEWISYIKEGFKRSPFLCVYFEGKLNWYEPQLREFYSKIQEDRQEIIVTQRQALHGATAEATL